jgi:putative spermidine/putrescine transport system permease protein
MIARRPRFSPWSWLWLLAAAVYFLVPLYGTLEFSMETGNGHYGLDAYQVIVNDPAFKDSFLLSLRLAVETVILAMILMVPTVYWIHLKLPKMRRGMDFIAMLPFVVPPIALGDGLIKLYHPLTWLIASPQILVLVYVILTLPFTYRSLDAGLRAIDLHTLTEAAQSVGARWPTILLRVILPNLRSAVLSSAFLTVTIVMGEYTLGRLLLFNTFAVYVQYTGETKAQPAAALAIISFGLTWMAMLGILVLGRRLGPRQQPQLGGTR